MVFAGDVRPKYYMYEVFKDLNTTMDIDTSDYKRTEQNGEPL